MKNSKVFSDPIEAALYLPASFNNYSTVIGDFSPIYMQPGLSGVFVGFLAEPPSTTFKKGRPQTKFSLTDGRYYLRFVVFGDVRELVDKLNEQPAHTQLFVFGEVTLINGYPYLNNAKFVEQKDSGTIKPVYPGIAGKMKPEPLAAYIAKAAKSVIPQAAQRIREKLMAHFTQQQIKQMLNLRPGITLDAVLNELHYPTDIDFSEYALKLMNRVATILAAADICHLSREATTTNVPPLKGPAYEKLLIGTKFQLTDEQEGIVKRTISKISEGSKLNLLLNGDVGTGKTVVYSLIAGYVAYARGRVLIMLPNGNLANQIHNEFDELFPDLNALLVMSDETDAQKILNAKVLIGTSALLFREVGQIHLAIFDESQKMGMAHQDQLVSDITHKISVSATPIPRTMALATYGAVTIERITKCHAVKNIYTRILRHNEFDTMVDEIMWAIQDAGKQVIVVCARKEDAPQTDEEPSNDIISVEDVFSYYERLLPGLVVTSHGGLTPEENAASLNAMRSGTAKLLVATTVIEVGVTLPDVAMLIVLNPERFGLSSLHQLRGRIARLGGDGWCTLFVNKINGLTNPKTIQRLNILTESTDGFFIAKQDMLLRSVGDLMSATTQHGKYVGLLRNADIDLAAVEQIVESLSV